MGAPAGAFSPGPGPGTTGPSSGDAVPGKQKAEAPCGPRVAARMVSGSVGFSQKITQIALQTVFTSKMAKSVREPGVAPGRSPAAGRSQRAPASLHFLAATAWTYMAASALPGCPSHYNSRAARDQ